MKTIAELLARIEEIRARAAEIASGEITDKEREELTALKAERAEAEKTVEDLKLAEELGADAPKHEPKADADKDGEGDKEGEKDGEGDKGDKPDAPDGVDVVTEDDDKDKDADKDKEGEKDGDKADQPTPEAIAAAMAFMQRQGDKDKDAENDGSGDKDGVKLAIVASSGAYGLEPGSEVEVSGWDRIHRAASNIRHDVEQRFAQIVRHSGEKALSGRNGAIENTVLMSQPREKQGVMIPITAAASYCGPNEVDKSIASMGEDDRPVAALIQNMPFTGPFDYVQDMQPGAVSTGVTIWNVDDQLAVTAADSGTWKPCVVLDCGDAVTVTPYAIPACGLFSTFQQLSHPELVDDFINKLGIVYARRAEQEILDYLRSVSTELTYSGATGAGLLHTLEGMLGHLGTVAGYVRRIDWSQYHLILPPGMLTVLVADEHRRGFSQNIDEAGIIARLKALGVGGVTVARDADTAAEAAILAGYAAIVDPGEVVAYDPCDVTGEYIVHLVPLAAYRRGESTLVEAGFRSDGGLRRQNMVEYFLEGHEFVEKVTPDVPSFTLNLTGAATGGSSALVTPEDCSPVVTP